MNGPDLIPLNVLTGFLGSGKTTLLRRLLASPRMATTAVLINEFGEVGLDHLLVQRVDATTVLLESGCVCCTVRADLREALRDLHAKAERGEVARFDRVVMETTGLADPVPILFTLMTDPVLRHHYRLSNVIATVDAVNAARQLAENPESVKQAAVADRILVTKTDLADAGTTRALRRDLARLNPSALVLDARADEVAPETLLAGDGFEPRTREVQGWLEQEAEERARPAGRAGLGRHAAEIASFHLEFDEPLDWTLFGIWLTMLLHRHGERVMRVKGILNVVGSPTPVCVNGVQHIVHPPFHLDSWPTPDRRSRLVFIVRGVEPGAIRDSLRAFHELAARP